MKGLRQLLCGCYEMVAGGSQKQHISSGLLCCRGSASQTFFLRGRPQPTPHESVPPPHMPSGRSSRSKRPTLSECVLQLGDPTVNQSAMEFPNLCF